MAKRERNFSQINWIEFDQFLGFQTRYHRSHKKARGYLVGSSQNVIVNEDGSISPRNGISILGATSSAGTPIKTLMKFKPRTGNEILIRTYGTLVEYYSTHSSKWETLLSGLTTGLLFGWEQMDFTDDAGTSPANYTFENELFFGNKTDGARGWKGATAKLSSTTTTTIVITGSTNLNALEPPFPATGSVIINGTTYTYTGLSSLTFTGVTPDPTGEAVNSSIALVTIDESANIPAANIYHKTDNARLMLAGATDKQGGIIISATNNPRDFVWSNPRVATDGAVINVAAFVKALEQLGDKIYHLGPDFIGYLRFTQIAGYSAGYDFIEIRPEVKGYDVGPTNELATAKWDNKVMYASQNAIKDLGSVISHNTFQVDNISALLKPTFDDADMSSAALVVYKSKLYVACKKTSGSAQNDIVHIYDILAGQWEAPVNKNVSCWIVANGNLYAGDAVNPIVYQWEVLDQYHDADNDGTNDTAFSIYPKAELWQENFGLPFERKTLYGCFLEGEINEGTTLNGEIQLDEDGYSGTLTFSITGTQAGIIFKSTSVNTFSLQSFATKTFASDTDATSRNYFRVMFQPRSISHFYIVSLIISSYNTTTTVDGWRVKRVGWKVDKWNKEDSGIKVSS